VRGEQEEKKTIKDEKYGGEDWKIPSARSGAGWLGRFVLYDFL